MKRGPRTPKKPAPANQRGAPPSLRPPLAAPETPGPRTAGLTRGRPPPPAGPLPAPSRRPLLPTPPGTLAPGRPLRPFLRALGSPTSFTAGRGQSESSSQPDRSFSQLGRWLGGGWEGSEGRCGTAGAEGLEGTWAPSTRPLGAMLDRGGGGQAGGSREGEAVSPPRAWPSQTPRPNCPGRGGGAGPGAGAGSRETPRAGEGIFFLPRVPEADPGDGAEVALGLCPLSHLESPSAHLPPPGPLRGSRGPDAPRSLLPPPSVVRIGETRARREPHTEDGVCQAHTWGGAWTGAGCRGRHRRPPATVPSLGTALAVHKSRGIPAARNVRSPRSLPEPLQDAAAREIPRAGHGRSRSSNPGPRARPSGRCQPVAGPGTPEPSGSFSAGSDQRRRSQGSGRAGPSTKQGQREAQHPRPVAAGATEQREPASDATRDGAERKDPGCPLPPTLLGSHWLNAQEPSCEGESTCEEF
ncbi:collagen alpha-1(I) chain-like [Lepus europaeus]|uniref:collagen alpha-1(I) chain-like n=1 Tax=Lepus europaeus TaxID=9983 RepID=UPI002B4A8F3F|nr:collagen alpha-1(I) chain-like [Lepus europaeus]